MGLQLFKTSSAAQVKAEAGSDSASSPLPLLKVGLGGPHCGIVCHVVVRSEQLHFLLAGVEDKDHIVDSDAGFSDVGGQNDLSHTLRSGLKHSSLFFPGDLRVKGQDSVARTTFEGHNIGGITMRYIK